MQELMRKRAAELLSSGEVNRVMGWRAGELVSDVTPAVFRSAEELCGADGLIYNELCGANLSKYMIKESRKEGKILVFLKPCDTYSFNQLLCEHRILRDGVYVIGIPCDGMLSAENIRRTLGDGVTALVRDGESYNAATLYGDKTAERSALLAERCLCCKSKKHVVYDELLGEESDETNSARFDGVSKLESMTPEQRYDFWRGELSRCIRCNACRNVCPACSCENCVFDNPDSKIANKAAADSFEENMFHIIRAFHVAGRCTDCGECSRVCPQGIPLHLLNRKLIKDMNELYGEYTAGESSDGRAPLVSYTQGDAEPSIVYERGGNS